MRARYKERLAGLDGEIEAFKKQVLREAEEEKGKIIDEALKFSARIKEQARLTSQQEQKEMARRIKEEIARLTVEEAEKLITEKITKSDHEKMVDDFIVKLRSHELISQSIAKRYAKGLFNVGEKNGKYKEYFN